MVKIYISTYHKYNSGSLAGEWLELPMSSGELDKALDRIAGLSPAEDRDDAEFMIQDAEADFKIDEADDIEELNELAEAIDDFDDSQSKAFSYFVDSGYSFMDAAQKAKDYEYFYIKADCERELGEKYIDEVLCGIENLDRETIERYFDFQAFGRDLAFDFTETENGYIMEN